MSRLTVPAHVAMESSGERLYAHLQLGVPIGPGDRVLLHGPPISLDFGERRLLTRPATVRRASPIRRWWTRLAGHFALTHLYEVSFSPRRLG